MISSTQNPAAQMQVVPFQYETNQIRVLQIEGNPYFTAIDVCKTLGLGKTEAVIRKLDEDEKLRRKFFASGQERELWLVSESGLYTLILRSNKPEAKPFRKWVTGVVLPTLRKTGSYSLPSVFKDESREKHLVDLIKEAAIKCGSQAALAKRVGVSDASLSQILNGQYEKYSEAMLYRLERSCSRIIQQGAGVDMELVQILLDIDDKKQRKLLFSKLQKSGVL